MKKYICHLLVLALLAMTTSCETTQKFTITGNPGSEIYTPDGERIATISANGEAKIKVSSDVYYAFMMSKDPGSDQKIPFALDYQKKLYAGSKFLKGAGMTLALAGLSVVFTGVIAIASGADDIGGAMAAAGGAAGLFGTSFGVPADFRQKQTDHEHKYAYLKSQKTNEDFTFSVPDYKEPYKEEMVTPEKLDEMIKEINELDAANFWTFALFGELPDDSKAATQEKDYSKLVEGEYLGAGMLSQSGKTIKSTDLWITIKRTSSSTAQVMVSGADGTDLFEKAEEYKVSKTDDGVLLINPKQKGANVKVLSDGTVQYNNPAVKIKGKTYRLEIKAKR